jgi:glycosyltransferase involved in cell wall biosynthesis
MNRRFPVVVDVRDLVWEYLSNQKGIKRIAGLLFRKMSSVCLSHASAVTVTNSLEQETLKRTGFNNAAIVRNGIEEERYLALSRIARRNTSAKREKLEILYVGNIGIAQELETIVMAVKDIEGAHCTIVGSGADACRLARLIAEQNISNITMIDPVPWDRLLDYYEDADVLYAQIGNDFTSAVPSKLFEYLSTGRTLLFGSAEGSARDLLREFGNVHFVPSGDAESQKNKILEIMKNRPLEVNWDTIDAVGNQHLRETQAGRFAQVVEKVYQGKKAACGSHRNVVHY